MGNRIDNMTTDERNAITKSELDSYELDKCLDQINHSVEMMRWNVTRKEVELDTRITGIRAWFANVTEQIAKMETLLQKLE